MSSIERLHWLANEIHMGRSAFVSFSFNAGNGREKIKFTLANTYDFHGIYRPCVMAALSAVQCAFDYSIVTDKGHRSKSTGQTIIEFWVKQIPFANDVGPCNDGMECMATYALDGDLKSGESDAPHSATQEDTTSTLQEDIVTDITLQEDIVSKAKLETIEALVDKSLQDMDAQLQNYAVSVKQQFDLIQKFARSFKDMPPIDQSKEEMITLHEEYLQMRRQFLADLDTTIAASRESCDGLFSGESESLARAVYEARSAPVIDRWSMSWEDMRAAICTET